MPFTPCADIPYPNPTASPDIQAHMQAMAEAVDAALCSLTTDPIGAITAWYEGDGSSPIPAGKLVCNGSSFSAVTYPDLEAHLGGTLLPDLRGRFLRHKDASGGAFPGVNQQGGFSDSIVVSHRHTQPEHNHNASHNHTGLIGNDTHSHAPLNTTATTETFVSRLASPDTSGGSQISLETGAGFRVEFAAPTTATDTHTHNLTIYQANLATTQSGDDDTGLTGQSGANRNTPPFVNVLFLMQAV